MIVDGQVGAARPTQDEAELAAALHRAVEDDALCLVYQPLVRSGDGRTLGVEALLRWELPGGGAIPPGTFVPVAERYGLMTKIGRWVLRTACAQLAEWQREGAAQELMVHVNLSAPELLDPDLLGCVVDTLQETGVDPERLSLEVTEDAIRAGGATAERNLNSLDDIGVRLTLDDFSTGSTIQALTKYHFDYAKISRGLIGGMDSPVHRARLIRGLLGMAKALGTTLIAEGIEQNEEIDRIAALGLVQIQGYATGRPVSGAELGRRLQAGPAWGQSISV